jgi:dTDP-4-dehydrorhamnose reductase
LNRPPTLIFGVTGFLGRTFFTGPSPGLIPVDRHRYDFSQGPTRDFSNFLRASNATSAIVTAAVSSPDACLENPSRSEAVNVTGTLELFRQLKELRIKPVFFSTDHVFNGEQGNYREDDAYSPITLYGRQKVAAETFVRENFTDFLILRTSKQVAMRVDPQNSLSEMALKLRAGLPIRCATDNWLAPSFVEDIVKITTGALQAGLTGVFHVAPEQQVSRLELGFLVADCMAASRELVEACSMKDFNFPEVRPPRCTLDGSKLRAALGIAITPLTEGLRELRRVL